MRSEPASGRKEGDMSKLGLSNLVYRSNLLLGDFDNEMPRITILELKDSWGRLGWSRWDDRRNSLTAKQQQDLEATLFWGSTSVGLDDGDRCRAWVEQLAEKMEGTLA